jgi:hypothetical protein
MIDPRPMNNPMEWADLSTPELLRFGPIPKMDGSFDWVNWGVRLIQLPSLATKQPPDPRYFTEWKDWATRFNQAVLA